MGIVCFRFAFSPALIDEPTMIQYKYIVLTYNFPESERNLFIYIKNGKTDVNEKKNGLDGKLLLRKFLFQYILK